MQHSEPTITLYDLASNTLGQPFSANTWQIRLALNYKQLRFKTIWLHMIDIKPTLKALGVTPTKYPFDSEPIYTVPVLVDSTTSSSSPVIIPETLPIAEYLDKTYPTPPLFPDGTKALLMLFHQHIEKQFIPLFYPMAIPPTGLFLAEKDRAYFRETRERWLGQPRFKEIMSQSKEEEEGHWERLKAAFGELARLLDQNGEGKTWVLGDIVSRADFVLIALFIWMGRLDPEGWKRIEGWDGGRWERMMKLAENWRGNEA